MKKLIRNILVVTALTPLFTNCASQDEVQRLRYQLHTVNKKLADMENSTVDDIQKRQAASSNQIDMLEREILILKGQLEETNMQNQQLKKQNDALQSNMGNLAREEAAQREEALQKINREQQEKEALIVELNEKLRAQEESLRDIQDARVRKADRRARAAKAKAEAAQARAMSATSSSGGNGIIHIESEKNKQIVSVSADNHVNTTSSTAPPSQPDKNRKTLAAKTDQQPKTVSKEQVEPPKKKDAAPTPPSATNPFTAGQNLFAEKQYDKAYKEFAKIADTNPTNDEGIRAGYMMGECLYAKKEYDKAILQYQKIISQNENHPKAASATLKQGMAFERLADAETAKMIYKKLVNHYSTSPEAKIAKEKLNSL